MALDVSPTVVLIHFTVANIYAHMKAFDVAAEFYQSSLALQPTLEPAKERLKAIECYKLTTRLTSSEPVVLIAPDG